MSNTQTSSSLFTCVIRIILAVAALFVAGVIIWQAMSSSGVPDPTRPNVPRGVAIFDIAVLVFREGLECVLVLSAILASMSQKNQTYRQPILAGAGVGFIASLITWFIAVGILNSLSENVSALHLQAATGLLAIIVLLIIMNWFFHKVYWGGWITMHNRRKKELISASAEESVSKLQLLWGLGLLGFTSLYREGFEIVLFLQSYRLRMGEAIVLEGALIGLLLTSIVAVLTFIAHKKLPYRKMLIVTGVMLGFVLLVMVGEQAQEMQLAGWIPTTEMPALSDLIPGWMGMWFAVFPTVETLLLQFLAGAIVIGSYFLARRAGAHTIARL